MKNLRLNQFIVVALLTIYMIFGASVTFASLQIYKVKGDVTVTSGKKSFKATRRTPIGMSDVLTIPAGGSIDILDTDSHRIYSSTKTGKMNVKSLMKKAESQANNITRNINRKVMAAVADNAKTKKTGYDAMGMAIHETDAAVPTLINIPDDMSYLDYLLAGPQETDSAHQSFISLSLKPGENEDQDSETPFNFTLSNSTGHPLYFNVAVKDDENGIRLLFPQNTIAAPRSDTTAEQFTFLPDKEIQRYVAIASKANFKISDAKHLLEADFSPKNNFYFTVLTLKAE